MNFRSIGLIVRGPEVQSETESFHSKIYLTNLELILSLNFIDRYLGVSTVLIIILDVPV